MATLQSIAMRRAEALARIVQVTEKLGQQQGLTALPAVSGQISRRDPNLAFAITLENIAQWLEDYATAQALRETQEVVDISPPQPKGKR